MVQAQVLQRPMVPVQSLTTSYTPPMQTMQTSSYMQPLTATTSIVQHPVLSSIAMPQVPIQALAMMQSVVMNTQLAGLVIERVVLSRAAHPGVAGTARPPGPFWRSARGGLRF